MIKRAPNVSDANERQKGFNWIMSKANQIYKSDEELIDFVFNNHPFGLPMFKKPRTNDYRLPIKYLKLGGPYLVVDNMPVLIARELNLHMCEAVESLFNFSFKIWISS